MSNLIQLHTALSKKRVQLGEILPHFVGGAHTDTFIAGFDSILLAIGRATNPDEINGIEVTIMLERLAIVKTALPFVRASESAFVSLSETPVATVGAMIARNKAAIGALMAEMLQDSLSIFDEVEKEFLVMRALYSFE